jgi:hypothetical protein
MTHRAGGRRLVRTLLATAVVPAALLAGVAGGVTASPGSASATVTSGVAAITKPGSLTKLDSGGSDTLFGVQLPAGASCPGDTAHDGYRVDSYLVPAGVSLSSVNFKTGLPDRGSGYVAYGRYYGAINTSLGSGLLVGLPPDLTMNRLTTRQLFPAGQKSVTWNGGIACATAGGVVTNYWNSRFVFTATPSDPHGFTWRVVAQPALAPSHSYLWIGIGLIVLSILLAAFAVFISQRRSDPSSGGPAPGGSPSPAGPATTGDPVASPEVGTDGEAVASGTSSRTAPAGQAAPEPSVAGR